MPDISMCAGGNCPKKQDCYRFIAKPSQYMQTYFVHPPYDVKEQTCEMFWDNSEYKEKNSV
jgi:hypothetical protein